MTTSSTLHTSRLLPVTPPDILRAFQDPASLARWWGPKGFRNTFHTFAFEPGGAWDLTMHSPDGADYLNKCRFEEISSDRLVIRHLEPMHHFLLTLTLGAEGGGTRLTWTMRFDSDEECDKVRAFVPRCNEENLDRLEAELARLTAGDRELVILRYVEAPPEKLYRAWTQPDLLKQWFAPLPYTTPVADLDVRPGGSSLIIMRGPDGTDLPNPGVYLEVVPNQKLVLTDAYTRAWEPSSKPFLTILLTFEDLGGRTRYTARALHWTVGDREMHEKMGFYPGWSQCADQLEALVARI